jgi:endonuclease III
MTPQERADKILPILKQQFPILKIPLDHRNSFELLIATILSAQTTDVKVNTVTPLLFARWPDARSLAVAEQSQVAEILRPLGLYNTKAKNIIAAAKILHEKFSDQVPDTFQDLLTLPGVARKVASVVLSQAFGKEEGFTVDTHVIRLSQKYGLTKHSDPIKIERELMQLFPRHEWGDTSLRIILHGRTCCKARGGKPRNECVLGEFWVGTASQ